VIAQLAGLSVQWGVAGGWALSLYAGEPLRDHEDIEIAIFQQDQSALRAHLGGWEFQFVPHRSGRLVPWPEGQFLQHPDHEIHARSPEGQQLQILLNERDGASWVFRKNRSVRLPLEKAFLPAGSGLHILAPEIVLLYKALSGERRPKDESDFHAMLPHLPAGGRAWLGAALAACRPEHPWLASLPAIKSDLRRTYDRNAPERERAGRAPWKVRERARFLAHLRRAEAVSLLEIGAGPGHDSLFFKEQGLVVTATDLSPEMVRLCREKGLQAYVRDFYKLGFPPESFDAVWAINCLLHVPSLDLPGVLAGIREALAPGGLFFYGVYGGMDQEGIWETDRQRPRRWFTFYSDRALKAAVRPYFELISFETIDLPHEFRGHFQSLVLKKAEQDIRHFQESRGK